MCVCVSLCTTQHRTVLIITFILQRISNCRDAVYWRGGKLLLAISMTWRHVGMTTGDASDWPGSRNASEERACMVFVHGYFAVRAVPFCVWDNTDMLKSSIRMMFIGIAVTGSTWVVLVIIMSRGTEICLPGLRAYFNVQWYTKCAVIKGKCAVTKVDLCS